MRLREASADESGAREAWIVLGGAAPELAAAWLVDVLDGLGARPGFVLPRAHRAAGAAGRLGGGPIVTTAEGLALGGLGAAPAEAGGEPVPVHVSTALVLAPEDDLDAAAVAVAVAALPAGARLVADVGDARVRALAAGRADVATVGFGLEGDAPAAPPPVWLGAPYAFQGGVQPLELFVGGTSCGRVFSPLAGPTFARWAVGVVACVAERTGAAVREVAAALRAFAGLVGLLEPVGQADGVRVVAHRDARPGARRLAVEALRAQAPHARLHAAGHVAAVGLEGADRVAVIAADAAGPATDACAAALIAGLGDGDAALVTAPEHPDHDLADAVLAALVARRVG